MNKAIAIQSPYMTSCLTTIIGTTLFCNIFEIFDMNVLRLNFEF